MEVDSVKISREEYERLRAITRVDQALLTEIAKGIRDIIEGRIKEI
jgi:hypothetical protein